MNTVAEILLLYSNQQFALHGHKESESSQNRENSLEILELMAKYGPIIHHRLNDGPENEVYTSSQIQNALLNVMGNMVRKQICEAVQRARIRIYF